MFAQPWAWLGLAGLAVPIAIHMLARHQAVHTLFPSLRFIDVTDVTFIKRQRLTDIPLLLIRLAVVAVAVAAMAGPRWLAASAVGRATVMAVVVDGSAGVVGGEAMTMARSAAATASSSTVVEAPSLASGIESAVAWLSTQTGARELVIVSDFQRGSLDAADIAMVPSGVGVRFTPVPRAPTTLPPGFELRGDRSRMTWPVAPATSSLPLTVKAGADQARADAMLSAVASLVMTSSADASARRATLLFPGAPDRAAMVAAARAIDQPWMFAVAQPLLNDPHTRGHVDVRAANAELIVMVDNDPGSPLSAGIASTVLTSLVQPLAWSEFEPEAIAPEQLRQWERAPSDAPSANEREPQGRWLWLIVIGLLGIETWMRRERRVAAAAEEAHARVA